MDTLGGWAPNTLPNKHPGGCKGASKVRVGRQDHPPLFEVGIEDPAGKAFSADPDALQDPIAAQLVHDQVVVHHAWEESVRGLSVAFSSFSLVFWTP